MGFEIKPEESLGKNLWRILFNQIENASSALQDDDESQIHDRVHEARKRFKRIRAVVRLSREALGHKVADRLNHQFRDAGRPLAELRDANVLVKTIESMAPPEAGTRPAEYDRVRAVLECRRSEACRRWIDQRDVFATILLEIQKPSDLLKQFELAREDWGTLAEGLAQSYDRCSRAFHEVGRSPDDESLHEWRKRIKDLLYQSQVVQPMRPSYFRRMEREANVIAELLGRDQDLAVLRRFLEQVSEEVTSLGSTESIAARLRDDRTESQRSALTQGATLLGESPEDFGRRVNAYCKAWRAELKASSFEKRRAVSHGHFDG